MHTLSVLFNRAQEVLQTEGLIPLLRRGFSFLRRYLFQYGHYYVYEHRMEEGNEADFMPKIRDLTFKIVSTNQQVDELVSDGFDFRSNIVNTRERLNKGAIASFIFIGRELAHIGWIALSEEAKNTFDGLPIQVDFSNNEAYIGAIRTNAKYRRMGLMTYGIFKRMQFLRGIGIIVSPYPVAKGNIASRRAIEKAGAKIRAEARHLRILWWQFWKETPLIETNRHD